MPNKIVHNMGECSNKIYQNKLDIFYSKKKKKFTKHNSKHCNCAVGIQLAVRNVKIPTGKNM